MSAYLASYKEIVDVDMCLAKNRTQRPLCHVSRMTRQCHLPSSPDVTPNFVAPGSWAVEHIPKATEAARNPPVLEP